MKKMIMAVSISLLLTGCSEGPSVSSTEVEKQLKKLGYTEMMLRSQMSGSPREWPWVCICKNDQNEEWGVLVPPQGEIYSLQLAVEGRLSQAQMLKKLESLGHKRDTYMENNLALVGTKEGDFYWSYAPPETDGSKPLQFDLAGNPRP